MAFFSMTTNTQTLSAAHRPLPTPTADHQPVDVPLLQRKIEALVGLINRYRQDGGERINDREIQVLKDAHVKVSTHAFNLAQHYFYSENLPEEGNKYLDQAFHFALDCRKKICSEANLNYKNWFLISQLYMFRIQLDIREISKVLPNERIKFIKQGLGSVNNALKYRESAEGFFQKFLLLQGLGDCGEQPKESPTQWLRRYLDHHPDPNSDDFFLYGRVYGGELAKQNRFQEAGEWFMGLVEKRDDALNCLSLGKVFQSISEGERALKWFELAVSKDPNNPEILLWFNAQKAKNILDFLRKTKKMPEQSEIRSMVSAFKGLFALSSSYRFSSEKTSTFIPLSDMARHFYATMVPDMAHSLGVYGEPVLAIELYISYLDSFDALAENGFIGISQKVPICAAIGTLYTQLEEFEKAENFLERALAQDRDFSIAYQNLVVLFALQKDGEKLRALWNRLEPIIQNLSSERDRENFSPVVFNLGTAFGVLGREHLKQAQRFYRLSLELDSQNRDALLHLARALSLTSDFAEGRDLLLRYFASKYLDGNPFLEFDANDFRAYFCLSGLHALLGEWDQADATADQARTCLQNEDTQNLQNYIQALKKSPGSDELRNSIKESIRMIKFQFRVGKFVEEKVLPSIRAH